MYKVFVNDKPIIFTTSVKNEEDYVVFIYKNIIMSELIYKLKLNKLKGVYIYTTNIARDWQGFKNKFKIIVSAGGLVINDKKEFLFIYRGNKWDLPKGKREKGEKLEETALREVEEECGVSNLTIKRKLIETYHFFIEKGKYRLKETHWYLMNSSCNKELTPQLEEGITKVMFKDLEDTREALKNTFYNITMVFKTHENLIDL
ncbi:NUDIX hydrolase [Tenacibaculum sp. Bg11-29]|uniref:NUDIX hydrolase n=1 Tax=Tenacibaculum sp. Bg11-29 TaxID=2058306 RepID=UPI001E478E17|nr:NUDIX domain-containing protein [Tenacibaculum sp. Bg11-29]